MKRRSFILGGAGVAAAAAAYQFGWLSEFKKDIPKCSYAYCG